MCACVYIYIYIYHLASYVLPHPQSFLHLCVRLFAYDNEPYLWRAHDGKSRYKHPCMCVCVHIDTGICMGAYACVKIVLYVFVYVCL